MIDYTLFFMTDGHIQGATQFAAETDGAALAQADALRNGAAAELWCRARRIAEFAGAPDGTTSLQNASAPVSARTLALADRRI